MISLCTLIDNISFNLYNIGRFLEIDDDIVGIKYAYNKLVTNRGLYKARVLKGKTSGVLFYNQVSIIINYNGYKVNVKVFKNGSAHMTNCKTVEDGENITRILLNKFDDLVDKTCYLVLSRDINGILLDKNNAMYNRSGVMIGNCIDSKTKLYTIDTIKVIFGLNVFTQMTNNKHKNIYSINGELIGTSSMEITNNDYMKYARFHRRNKNIKTINDSIYYNDTLIGIVKYEYKDNYIPDTQIGKDSIIELDYSCNPYIDTGTLDIHRVIHTSVNCINVNTSLKTSLIKQDFVDFLRDMNLLVIYDPETYNGIKLIFQVPILDNYTDFDYHSILTNQCDQQTFNITLLIFKTGNIIGTGFKTIASIDPVLTVFNDIFTKFKQTF